MSRAVIGLDRILTFVVGLVLLALGVAGALWWRGSFPSWPHTLNLRSVLDLTTQPWWPWAAGLVGLVLLLAGLRWLVSHLPSPAVTHLTLPGSTPAGALVAQARPVAAAAAEALQQTTEVRSARGTVRQERGQLTVRLTATIDPHADLHLIAATADHVAADLAKVLQRDDLHCQVLPGQPRHRPPSSFHVPCRLTITATWALRINTDRPRVAHTKGGIVLGLAGWLRLGDAAAWFTVSTEGSPPQLSVTAHRTTASVVGAGTVCGRRTSRRCRLTLPPPPALPRTP